MFSVILDLRLGAIIINFGKFFAIIIQLFLLFHSLSSFRYSNYAFIIPFEIASSLYFFFFLATQNVLWDLSSPTRDWTQAMAVKAQNPNQETPLSHHSRMFWGFFFHSLHFSLESFDWPIFFLKYNWFTMLYLITGVHLLTFFLTSLLEYNCFTMLC